MLTSSFTFFMALYVAAGIGLIGSLWLYREGCDIRFYQNRRVRAVFHCIQCGQLYTHRKQRDTAPCPKCRYKNLRRKF